MIFSDVRRWITIPIGHSNSGASASLQQAPSPPSSQNGFPMYSTTFDPPDYDVLTAALYGAESGLDASECHGILVGMICGSDLAQDLNWLPYVLNVDGAGSDEEERERCIGLLDTLFAWTVQGLESDDLAFDLLLPDAESNIDKRAEAMAAWARGFLSGLGLVGVQDELSDSEEIGEVLNDFSEISRSFATDDTDNSEQEDSFAEIQEYMRMSVLIVFNELSQRTSERELH